MAISAGSYHTVGIKADGTMVATEYTWNKDYYHDQCNVSGWKNIVCIDASYGNTIAVTKDGTVLIIGYDQYGQCSISNTKNIATP